MLLAKHAIDECIIVGLFLWMPISSNALEMVGVRGFEPPTT